MDMTYLPDLWTTLEGVAHKSLEKLEAFPQLLG
jgi:hypothetical protein